MKTLLSTLTLVILAVAPALEAQGIQIIGHRAFANESPRELVSEGWEGNPYEEGTLLGIEISGQSIGFGVSAYSAGAFTTDTEEIVGRGINLAGEANYFLRLPHRLSPYAGAVVALARFDDENGFAMRDFDDFGLPEIGWQVGLRWKPIPLIGVDVRTRALRGEYATGRHGSDRQWLLGLTLF